MIETFLQVVFKTVGGGGYWGHSSHYRQRWHFWLQRTETENFGGTGGDLWSLLLSETEPCLLPISSLRTLQQIVNNFFPFIVIPSSVLCASIAFCGITHSFKRNLNKSWNTTSGHMLIDKLRGINRKETCSLVPEIRPGMIKYLGM